MTYPLPSEAPQGWLTNEDVAAIRRKIQRGDTQLELVIEYNVPFSVILAIKNKTYFRG